MANCFYKKKNSFDILQSHILPICLPTSRRGRLTSGSKAWVTGWGKVDHEDVDVYVRCSCCPSSTRICIYGIGPKPWLLLRKGGS